MTDAAATCDEKADDKKVSFVVENTPTQVFLNDTAEKETTTADSKSTQPG